MSQTNIIVKLQIEGLHNWPEARQILPEMGFLSDMHRHMFWISVQKKVTHDDRDIEIIQFKRQINTCLLLNYSVVCLGQSPVRC